MDRNWQETLVELTILYKCKNIAGEFYRRIGDNAPIICLGIKVILLGNRRIILLKQVLSIGNNHLCTSEENLIERFHLSISCHILK